ncbi:MAG TPA: hypothetical protein VFW16_03295 [Streptosporangiaceae bacterium]|nr:hypothetical protein [Streptosporangiaceae bacterium]
MKQETAHMDQARKVADAVLYEGYLLYPYHQSAQKNQARFQFGVHMPPDYGSVDPTEPSASQTECLVECADDAQVLVSVRFLQLQRRRVVQMLPDSGRTRDVASLTVDGTEYTAWDEAIEREQQICAEVRELLSGDLALTLHVEPGEATQDVVVASTGRVAGRLVRSWSAIDGVIRLRAGRTAGPYGALKLGVRIENHSLPATRPRTREDGLTHALIAAHTLIWVPGGRFLSMTDPPEWAAPAVAGCENIGTWPVLAGPPDCHDLVLASPVILYDHAEVAPESDGDLFDATEIDEILTLRTLALTGEEKRAARATDRKAAELMDRLEGMPPEMFDRLHGAIRYLRSAPGGTSNGTSVGGTNDTGPATGEPAVAEPGKPETPWWDPGADASVSPETDHVVIAGVRIARGSRVTMLPGARRADAQDLFLTGREATVQAIFHDVDGNVHVAVSPDGDEAADLQGSHGRYLYFGVDEVKPALPGRREPELKEDPA